MKQPKYTDLLRYPHGYKPANQTDIKETFARIAERQKEEAAWRLKNAIELKRKAK